MEANDEHPVVITHSVSADFPTTLYADKRWLKEAKKLHGEDYLRHFDELPDEEQWRLTLPRLMKEEAVIQCTRPLSAMAEYVRHDLMQKGLWKACVPSSVTEKEILTAMSWPGMKSVLETFYGRLKPKATELLGDEPIYVICNSLDSMVIAEEFARDQGDRLLGIAHVYMQVLPSGWRKDFTVIPYNPYVEECAADAPTVFLPMAMLAVAEEVIKLIEMLGDKAVPSRVIVLAALANAPQARLIEHHFSGHSFRVTVHALEEVNDSLLAARDHLGEMTRGSSHIQPPASKWFWRRMIDAMKREEEAESRKT